jgi:WD40 repeat protein
MSSQPHASENQDQHCPYKGLMPYLEEDSPFFFGREKWSRIITDNLMATRLTLLYGSSGVGKSSVLRAGVVDPLRQLAQQHVQVTNSTEFAIIVFNTWQDDPVVGLIQKVEKDIRKILPDVAMPASADSLAETLQAWTKLIGTEDKSGKLLIILDQFEEYFLYHPNEEGEGSFAIQFPQALNCPDLPANFLISIREDALAKLDYFKGQIPDLFSNYLRLPHLDEQSALDAIRKPIRVFNQQQESGAKSIGIEPELVKEVIEQVKVGKVSLGESGKGGINIQSKSSIEAEIETPYLQLVMTRLWDEEINNGSDCLHLETFKRLGGAEKMVQQHLNERMEPLSNREKDIAAKIFQYLVTPGGSKITYPAPELAETAGVSSQDLDLLLEELSRQRILRPVAPLPESPNVKRYEIFHDKLASAILSWRAKRIEENKLELEKQRLELENKLEKEKLELAQEKRYFKKQTRDTILSLLFLVPSLILMTLYIKSNSDISKVNDIINASVVHDYNHRYGESIVYSLRAASAFQEFSVNINPLYKITSSSLKIRLINQLKMSLEQAYGSHQYNMIQPYRDGVSIRSIDISSDGKFIATGSEDGKVKIWETDGTARNISQLFKEFHNKDDRINSLKFSPNGQELLIGTSKNHLYWWKINQREPNKISLKYYATKCEGNPEKPFVSIMSVAFSQNGEFISSSGTYGNINIFRRDDNLNPPYEKMKFLTELNNPNESYPLCWGTARSIGFSLNPQNLAVGFDYDGNLGILSTQRKIPIKLDYGHTSKVNSVIFNYSKNILASGSDDGAIILRNAEILSNNKDLVYDEVKQATKPLKIFIGHGSGVRSVAFGNSGEFLASGSDDTTVRLWSTEPKRIGSEHRDSATATFNGYGGVVYSVAVTPNEKFVLSGHGDGAIRVWKIDTQRETESLKPNLDLKSLKKKSCDWVSDYLRSKYVLSKLSPSSSNSEEVKQAEEDLKLCNLPIPKS